MDPNNNPPAFPTEEEKPVVERVIEVLKYVQSQEYGEGGSPFKEGMDHAIQSLETWKDGNDPY